MKRRRGNRLAAFDPVKEYDGLCQYGNRRISPEEMTENARHQMKIMEQHPVARRQDDEANHTPIGGMQFH